MRLPLPIVILALISPLVLCNCVESTSLASSSPTSQPAHLTSPPPSQPPVPTQKLSKHDAALRFLTAYIRHDRGLASQVATPKAISKLDWNRPHHGNVPYFDDKMFLYYPGGLAKVYFQEVNGSYIVSDLQTHAR